MYQFTLRIRKGFAPLISNDNRPTDTSSFMIPDGEQHYDLPGKTLYLVGDPIPEANSSIEETVFRNKDSIAAITTCIKGFYYFIEIDVINNKVLISSSLFGILPVYYLQQNDELILSSDLNHILELSSRERPVSKSYLLEHTLFNYPFLNRTLYDGVNTLPANAALVVDYATMDIDISKHLNIVEYFNPIIRNTTRSTDQLTDLFIQTTKEYIPKDKFHVSLTGGFDGRTLLSVCSGHENFKGTYSYGAPENHDVIIPREIASALSLNHTWINLSEAEYHSANYLNSAHTYSRINPGSNHLLYAHIAYGAKILSNESKYLLTGYFGSELFRALHINGAMTTQALFDLFAIENDDKFIQAIRNSDSLKLLNKSSFVSEMDQLIEELLLYRKNIPGGLTINQQFYCYVFEELFRKFFGNWIRSQLPWLNIRSPFLDFNFICELFKSPLAGINNDFFTHNPFKRQKGQVLYANILKKTNSILYHHRTGKGYCPKDVVSAMGMIKVVPAYLHKKLIKKQQPVNLDNLGIISALTANQGKLEDYIQQSSYFNNSYLKGLISEINPFMKEKQRDQILFAMSIHHYLQHD